MIYKVMLWFRGNAVFEVEAKDDEWAESEAIDMLNEACEGISVETHDAVVTKSGNQYTDQQELENREREGE